MGLFGAGRVFLKPASAGTGVIAGAGVRAVLELGGVKDILEQVARHANPINMVRATEDGIAPADAAEVAQAPRQVRARHPADPEGDGCDRGRRRR